MCIQVTYMSRWNYNRFMPQFKRAALTDIQVQAKLVSMYFGFENGCPIVTAMSLTFTEVDVITRNEPVLVLTLDTDVYST